MDFLDLSLLGLDSVLYIVISAYISDFANRLENEETLGQVMGTSLVQVKMLLIYMERGSRLIKWSLAVDHNASLTCFASFQVCSFWCISLLINL